FASTNAALASSTSTNGQNDIVITNTGKIVFAFNGGNPDQSLRGVWISTTGNIGSFTRIAGGSVLGVDSVNGWRANSYLALAGTSNPTQFAGKRIVMALAPSNQNIVYVLYDNGMSSGGTPAVPEADMFKLDMTGGTNTWTNL